MAEYLKGTFYWHIDGATDAVPARATMLTAKRLAPTGGQTEFCNTYAAYDDLPADKKPYYDSLRIVHSLEASQRVVNPNLTAQELTQIRSRGQSREQPLVWRHASGRKSLVLGTTGGHFVGMADDQSRQLLADLTAHATRREIVYQHDWQLGDLVLWDNCGTMHRVIPYAADCGRMMHRTTLHGVEAIS
jgi:alpha-ketoglutarate-dependent taurine dioxygenase